MAKLRAQREWREWHAQRAQREWRAQRAQREWRAQLVIRGRDMKRALAETARYSQRARKRQKTRLDLQGP